jgi:hypothetical protein
MKLMTLLNGIGLGLIAIGIAIWIYGSNHGPVVFLAGLIVEGVGYMLAGLKYWKSKK